MAVVGAGAAGLAAFDALRAAGCDAVLIEARSRIGGRIRTLHPPDWLAPVEMGAEFIHGAPAELMPFAESPGGRDYAVHGRRLRPVDEMGFAGGDVFEHMHAEAGRPDRSFADFVEHCHGISAEARRRALAYIEGFEAADPARISVASLIREQQAEAAEDHAASGGDAEWAGPRRPRGGYGRCLAALRPRGAVWLRSPIVQIAWRPGEVVLQVAGGRAVRARRAIVTLPLSLLQQGTPRFDPPLEAKRNALDHLVMGGARRITLRLRRAFWPGDLRFLFGADAGPRGAGHFPTWWTEPIPPGTPGAQITGWAAGRHAAALAGMPVAALAARALAGLARLLGMPAADLRAALIAAHSHDWESDPWALGAYSYAAVGGADAFGDLAQPLADTLFFAGEATDATSHHATVQGALRSGRRAAAEALDGI